MTVMVWFSRKNGRVLGLVNEETSRLVAVSPENDQVKHGMW